MKIYYLKFKGNTIHKLLTDQPGQKMLLPNKKTFVEFNLKAFELGFAAAKEIVFR